MTDEDAEEENGECEQAEAEITVATHDGMIAARVAGSEDEMAAEVAEVLAEVIESAQEVSSTERRIGFE